MVATLIEEFLALIAQIIILMSYSLDGVNLVMSWLWYWHSADYIPLWFSGTVDAFLLVLVARWTVRLIRLVLGIIHDVLDAIPIVG